MFKRDAALGAVNIFKMFERDAGLFRICNMSTIISFVTDAFGSGDHAMS